MDRIKCTNENVKRHDEGEICWMRINYAYENGTQKNRVKLFESAQMDLTNAKLTERRIQRELSAICIVVWFAE